MTHYESSSLFGSQAPNPNGLKLVFVGDTAVGKTTLMNTMYLLSKDTSLHNSSDKLPETNRAATIGVDLLRLTYVCDDTPILFDVWDTAGMEKYAVISEAYFRKTTIVILVYDVTRPSTFSRLTTYWVPLLRRFIERSMRNPRNLMPLMFILGNKVDKVSASTPTVTYEESFAATINARHFLVSALVPKSVRETLDVICQLLLPVMGAYQGMYADEQIRQKCVIVEREKKPEDKCKC